MRQVVQQEAEHERASGETLEERQERVAAAIVYMSCVHGGLADLSYAKVPHDRDSPNPSSGSAVDGTETVARMQRVS